MSRYNHAIGFSFTIENDVDPEQIHEWLQKPENKELLIKQVKKSLQEEPNSERFDCWDSYEL